MTDKNFLSNKHMSRPRTYFELNRLAEIAKRREAAREATKLAATPKPYKAEDPGGKAYFRSIEDENLFVLMPIPAKAGALVTDPAPILGLDLAAATAVANSSLVDFKGNHDKVLRIRFTRLKATPTVKVTAWGTRVVDHIDDSVTVPFGGNSDASLKGAKTAFATAMANATMTGLLGSRKGNYAELLYNNRVIAKKTVTT
ncbi:hypothetical protein QUB05_05570 [Microcoleus sp. F10-C6]|uniref:hypothetical protein n=1 Tax=unclassified Microcoleus TaxID=2642155 RepID=UPI002FCE8A1C